MLLPIVDLLFLFFFAFCSLFIVRKGAKLVGLVDHPLGRKQHQDVTPLAGGIALCITLLYLLFHNPNLLDNSSLYAICIVLLTTVGAIDDKYDVHYSVRFAIQAILSIAMMTLGNIELSNLGNIFGWGDIHLGGWGYVITTIAVIAAINAFNMVDGIDGLLGCLSIVTFGSLAWILNSDGQQTLAYFCLALVVAILPYILLNLGVLGRKRKVFMGDAGSMLVGFTVVWVLLLSSQNGKTPPLQPVTALWLIAIPLMDMVTLTIRRIQRGDSPFKPDREHLHHLFQNLGLSPRQTLIAIIAIAVCFAGVGIYAELKGVPDYLMLYVYIVLFIAYYLLVCLINKKTIPR
ncbi:UDP-N-acetylglucosamine--undecaprenyl-phosphate N-acetylglucosaminephosphotransferase [Salinivibrio sp. ES.052]|uniref:UDP-N-acetylglucosamine--undecaprenyl-phosphate N-acetylglucosaminephosphotransferase n=1 Tax=Salinivibrio sp. ES.052 TaxID=1882823 RepID=UPI000940BF69|nr:UDP-N-acetylglucosamine--undecaprenyl-phosphate N-acetylglucosaminephosphotransferase [Salinivibrio sp. ES.052]